MDVRQRIERALFAKDYAVPGDVAAGVKEFHESLRTSNRTVTSFRNNPRGDRGFDTTPLEQPSSRLADVVSVSFLDGEVLYRLVKEFQPEYILEIGTGTGTSATFIMSALRDSESWYVLTLEGSEDMVKVAKKQLNQFDRNKWSILVGLFNETVPTLNTALPCINMAFIDDEHRADAIYRDMQYIPPLMPDGGLIVFDDIDWYSAKDAWWQICASS